MTRKSRKNVFEEKSLRDPRRSSGGPKPRGLLQVSQPKIVFSMKRETRSRSSEKEENKMQAENLLPSEDRLKNIEVVKVMLVRDSGNQYRSKSIKGQRDAAFVVREFLAGEDREVFLAICINNRNGINSINIVSIGSLDSAIVAPREVFKTAILSNAKAIVIAHNHPSGNPTPSEEDIRITRGLFEAGKLLGITVLDHIIVGEDEWASVRLEGEDIIWDRRKFEELENTKGASRIGTEAANRKDRRRVKRGSRGADSPRPLQNMIEAARSAGKI